MAEPVGEDRQVKFVFRQAPGYRVIAANGVWGGVTPRGDLSMDFYVEALSTPESIAHLVRADGKLGDELSRSPAERPFVRELQVGVLLSLSQAESIGRWLIDKVEDFRKRTGDTESEA